MSEPEGFTVEAKAIVVTATSSSSHAPTMNVTTSTSRSGSMNSTASTRGRTLIHTGTSCHGFAGLLIFKRDINIFGGLVSANEKREIFLMTGVSSCEVAYQPFRHDGLLNGFAFDKNIVSFFDHHGQHYDVKLPVTVACTDSVRLSNRKMLTNLCITIFDQSVSVEYDFDDIPTSSTTSKQMHKTCTRKKLTKGHYLAILGVGVALGVFFFMLMKYSQKRSEEKANAEEDDFIPRTLAVGETSGAVEPPPRANTRFSFDE
jgi:hypothetical protein